MAERTVNSIKMVEAEMKEALIFYAMCKFKLKREQINEVQILMNQGKFGEYGVQFFVYYDKIPTPTINVQETTQQDVDTFYNGIKPLDVSGS